MNAPPIAALSRRARRLLLIPFAPLLPLAVVAGLAFLQPYLDCAVVRWAVQYWWVVTGALAPIYLILAHGLHWLLRCPTCRYRLARAGVQPLYLARASANAIRFCPHCGTDWRAPATR